MSPIIHPYPYEAELLRQPATQPQRGPLFSLTLLATCVFSCRPASPLKVGDLRWTYETPNCIIHFVVQNPSPAAIHAKVRVTLYNDHRIAKTEAPEIILQHFIDREIRGGEETLIDLSLETPLRYDLVEATMAPV